MIKLVKIMEKPHSTGYHVTKWKYIHEKNFRSFAGQRPLDERCFDKCF